MKGILVFVMAAVLLSSAASVSAINCVDNPANHGAYVSCIARQHLGGSVTSQAAQSNIGKKISSSPTPTPITTTTPAVTPTPTPTETPTSTVTPTPTVTPIETTTSTVTPTPTPATTSEQEPLSTELKKLLDQIKKLIGSFVYLPNY